MTAPRGLGASRAPRRRHERLCGARGPFAARGQPASRPRATSEPRALRNPAGSPPPRRSQGRRRQRATGAPSSWTWARGLAGRRGLRSGALARPRDPQVLRRSPGLRRGRFSCGGDPLEGTRRGGLQRGLRYAAAEWLLVMGAGARCRKVACGPGTLGPRLALPGVRPESYRVQFEARFQSPTSSPPPYTVRVEGDKDGLSSARFRCGVHWFHTMTKDTSACPAIRRGASHARSGPPHRLGEGPRPRHDAAADEQGLLGTARGAGWRALPAPGRAPGFRSAAPGSENSEGRARRGRLRDPGGWGILVSECWNRDIWPAVCGEQHLLQQRHPHT